MNEKPILFSTDMVKAILDDRKTQTRRVIKLPKWPDNPSYPDDWTIRKGVNIWIAHATKLNYQEYIKCPYGQAGNSEWKAGMPPSDGFYHVQTFDKPIWLRRFEGSLLWGWDESDDPEAIELADLTLDTIRWKRPGDRLWVREKALYWVSPILEGFEYDKPSDWWSDCVYQDDPEIPLLLRDNGMFRPMREIHEVIEGEPVFGKWEWKPSIHMPKHYSRITLEITEVRVERVQEISEDDAIQEGCKAFYEQKDAHIHFSVLWDTINKKRGYGWDTNCWVWVISFKVVTE